MQHASQLNQDKSTPAHHTSFSFIRREKIESLKIEIQEFEHTTTGAKHFHFSADSDENVFLVGFRTVPENSNGVAHILEHTSLCGSRSYPVRDPFFMMTRRSINTFMNALTSSDWTAYPFASKNEKDFNNLLDVYLDAVFFARLDPLDFSQEGHRLEFQEPDNIESELEFKGVVYNEMKGAMSSVTSQLWHTLTKYLYPSNTYHHNSGGNPESIPDLTYQQLVDFYKKHYHPSNATFMTFGKMKADTLQAKFDKCALNEFKKSNEKIDIADTKRYFSPVRVQESYPYSQQDKQDKSHVVLGWLLGHSTDIKYALRAQLVASVLLDNSASPLMLALESTDLGSSPSPLCGIDDSQKEMTFICGLEGCNDQSADAIEKLIFETLNNVIKNGVAQEEIESSLHQLELHQREVGGDSYPYGLQLIMATLTSVVHRGDPIEQLDIDRALEQLRDDIQDPNFIQTAIKDLFIDNPHMVRLLLTPDDTMLEKKQKSEKDILALKKSKLSKEDKEEIVQLAKKLKDRQEQIDDETVLPKVSLSDVPTKESHVEPIVCTLKKSGIKLSLYNAPTNGLCYQQFIYPLCELADQQIDYLPLYSSCITELGINNLSYIDTQRWQAKATGGVSAYTSIRTSLDNLDSLNSYFTYSAKALNRNHDELTTLMTSLVQSPRFDETSRIKEIVSQIRAYKEQGVTGNGHSLAMTAAASGFCSHAKLHHTWSGLAGIQKIKSLDNALQDKHNLEKLADQFRLIHESITQSTPEVLLISEDNYHESMIKTLEKSNIFERSTSFSPFDLPKINHKTHQAWLTNSQVNFCARAFPTVGMKHEDAAALVILGGVLRNGFLHKHIREQGGAYGGGASQDSAIGAFKFYSYRDPRLADTLSDFDKSIDWILNENHSFNRIEEAILGTISSIDRSESPAGKAKRCFYQELHERTLQDRQLFRERILSVTQEDIKRVANQYLNTDKASTVVITDLSKSDYAQDLGLEIIEL